MARIVSFTTPLMDSTGLVRFPWRGPGDALSESNISDVRFRPRDMRAHALLIEELRSARARPGRAVVQRRARTVDAR